MAATQKIQRVFSACTECPHCNVVAVHYLRSARRFTRREDCNTLAEFKMARMMERSWMSASLSWALPYRTDLLEEDKAEVVRTCTSCDSEWCEY